MSVTLTKDQEAQVRASAHGMSGPDQEAFLQRVKGRLEANGVPVTTPLVASAVTAELMRDK